MVRQHPNRAGPLLPLAMKQVVAADGDEVAGVVVLGVQGVGGDHRVAEVQPAPPPAHLLLRSQSRPPNRAPNQTPNQTRARPRPQTRRWPR